ncbi:MAG: hypothetical protein AAF432_00425 [Planctomycetota bacterium]
MALSGSINLGVDMKLTGTSGLAADLDSLTNANLALALTLTDGSGANQAQTMWHDRRTLAAGASEDLDLAGGLTNGLGETITFTNVRALIIKNNDTVNTTLGVGNASTNAVSTIFGNVSDLIVVRPEGVFALYCGNDTNPYAITAGSADILQIARGLGSPSDTTYDIIIIGTTS